MPRVLDDDVNPGADGIPNESFDTAKKTVSIVLTGWVSDDWTCDAVVGARDGQPQTPQKPIVDPSPQGPLDSRTKKIEAWPCVAFERYSDAKPRVEQRAR